MKRPELMFGDPSLADGTEDGRGSWRGAAIILSLPFE